MGQGDRSTADRYVRRDRTGNIGRLLISRRLQLREIIYRGIRVIREIGLSRRIAVPEVSVQLCPEAAIPITRQLRNSDGRQDGDDGHDDHEFDQRKPSLSDSLPKTADHQLTPLLFCDIAKSLRFA